MEWNPRLEKQKRTDWSDEKDKRSDWSDNRQKTGDWLVEKERGAEWHDSRKIDEILNEPNFIAKQKDTI